MSDSAPGHARVVADADVLAADLLVGGSAREALDIVRRHSWLESVVTDPLLSDAEAVVANLADDELAADWRRLLEERAVVVDQPAGDHPALAAAYRGEAARTAGSRPDQSSFPGAVRTCPVLRTTRRRGGC